MEKFEQLQNESTSKGNSEDSLLVIYILSILKKYSSPNNPLSSQDVMEHLREDYSIGSLDKANSQRKKVRRHLDTLHESYWNGCIKKVEGKTRNGHKWYYDISRDKFAKEEGIFHETLSKEEIDFIIDIITSSKIINSSSTISIVNKLLKKTKHLKKERIARLRKIENEQWPKSINKELLLIKQDIQSCIDDVRKMKFDYKSKKSILATPYGWDSDESGKYILIAKVDGEREGEFSSFCLEKIHNIEKADFDYNDFDDTYFDLSYGRPDAVSLESLFSNIKIITDAIEKKNGIEFKYLSYAIRGVRVVVDGKDKRVLPHRLVFNDGKYYLIGYDEEQEKIDYYRVDLISKLGYSSTKIKISDWDARVLSGVQRAREVEKHPLMLAGTDIPVTFKVVESALDRVIDAFVAKPDTFNVTKETRTVKDSFGEGFHEERLVEVRVRTTLEEAYRWTLANADVVESVSPQEIRDRIAQIVDPIYQLYTQTLSDKVRENIDHVLREGAFKISCMVDENTAYETYKELSKRGKLGVVDNIGIVRACICDFEDYIGDFINAKRLYISAPQCKNLSRASRLVNLETLDLLQIRIDDTSWMKELKKLRQVYILDSSISDLSVLSEHKNIDYLDISDTTVRDISFIEKYQKLTYLNIVGCPIEDYSPLFTTQSRLKCLEIDEKAIQKIGEEKIRENHIGIDIKIHKNSPFWRNLI